MACFTFRLESVLRHREQQQEQAEQALAAAQREREERVLALNANQLQLAEALRGEENIELHAALHMQVYLEHLRQRGRDLTAGLNEAERIVQERLEQLVLARQKKKALENLKGHRRQAFEAEQRRNEQKTLDEVGTRSALRADDTTQGKGGETV